MAASSFESETFQAPESSEAFGLFIFHRPEIGVVPGSRRSRGKAQPPILFNFAIPPTSESSKALGDPGAKHSRQFFINVNARFWDQGCRQAKSTTLPTKLARPDNTTKCLHTH